MRRINYASLNRTSAHGRFVENSAVEAVSLIQFVLLTVAEDDDGARQVISGVFYEFWLERHVPASHLPAVDRPLVDLWGSQEPLAATGRARQRPDDRLRR